MTAPDVGRIGAAISYPGIDPRIWQSLAVVTAVQVSANGVKVDIELHPSGVEETARVGAEYASVGVGLYFPIKVDDEVIVGYPNGDRASGLVVLRRLHSTSDPLPTQAVDAPSDVWLVVDGDTNVNIIVAGGKVFLGDSTGTSPVACVGNKIQITAAQILAAGLTAGATAVTLSVPLEGTITTGASKVEAK